MNPVNSLDLSRRDKIIFLDADLNSKKEGEKDMPFDYLQSLNKIREALRKNDDSSFIAEVLNFLANPFESLTHFDEYARIVLEFKALVLSENRLDNYKSYAKLLDTNLKWVKTYLAVSESERAKQDAVKICEGISKIYSEKYPLFYIHHNRLEDLAAVSRNLAIGLTVTFEPGSLEEDLDEYNEEYDAPLKYKRTVEGELFLNPLGFTPKFRFTPGYFEINMHIGNSTVRQEHLNSLRVNHDWYRDCSESFRYTLDKPYEIFSDVFKSEITTILEKWKDYLDRWEARRIEYIVGLEIHLQRMKILTTKGRNS